MTGKAFFWSADRGGSGFYRMQLPSKMLEKLGVEVNETSYYVPSYVKNATVVGQRIANPAPSERWLEICERPDTTTVYDIDDDYFAVDPLSSTAHQFFNQSSVQNRIIANARAADYITTCSHTLTRVMQEKCPGSKVVTIPNGLPIKMLNWSRPENDRVVIGWVGTGQTWFELEPIAHHLNKFLRANPEVQLHTIGVQPEVLIRIGLDTTLGDQVKVTGPISDIWEYLGTIDFDVWIAPYRGTTFNRGKFATKALESMFLGIPLVASNIDGYRATVTHGQTGFLVRQPDHEWGRYMRMLTTDKDLRTQMGRVARRRAKYYTTESLSQHWLQFIKGGPR